MKSLEVVCVGWSGGGFLSSKLQMHKENYVYNLIYREEREREKTHFGRRRCRCRTIIIIKISCYIPIKFNDDLLHLLSIFNRTLLLVAGCTLRLRRHWRDEVEVYGLCTCENETNEWTCRLEGTGASCSVHVDAI